MAIKCTLLHGLVMILLLLTLLVSCMFHSSFIFPFLESLTPYSRFLLENLILAQLFKKSPKFIQPKRSLLLLLSILSQSIPMYTPPIYSFKIHFNVFLQTYFYTPSDINWGRNSSVGVTTDYGLGGPGIKSRRGRDFSHTSGPASRPTQPVGTGSFPGLKRPPTPF
jgi:hypothetical protein